VPLPTDSAQWRSLAERVALHRLYERNKHLGPLKEAFPYKPHLWTSDFFFPYAKGGPLFIDQPILVQDVPDCELKKETMLNAGLRYLIIKPKMKYEDCMLELLEIDARIAKNGLDESRD
jgi:hypothetical protein